MKNVPPINIEVLLQLSNANPHVREALLHDLGWLLDPQRYKKLPPRSANGTPIARLSQLFVQQLKDAGVTREIRRCDVRGYVKMFTVAQPFKKPPCHRPIKHTYEINEIYGKETLRPDVKFPGKPQIVNFPLLGTHFVSLDFSAYFDQFQYHPDVGTYMCFRFGNKFYCLDRLAMGQRHAVEVAQATTKFLLDAPGMRCFSDSVIDNVIIIGSYEDVLHDLQLFLDRCKAIGATLNETKIIEENGVESLITQKDEWCGVAIDMLNKSVALTGKTLKKLQLSWENRDNWTWRQFAAHIGLLFWSWGILDIPIETYYPLLRFISEIGRMLSEDDSLWDSPAIIWKSAAEPLSQWSALALENSPRAVKASTEPQWILCTDACRFGWGYVAFNRQSGEMRTHGQAWSKEQLHRFFHGKSKQIAKSVYSEPLAVKNSLCHLMSVGFIPNIKIIAGSSNKNPEQDLRTKILVATDNSATKHTFNRGFASRSYSINAAIEELKKAFPDALFDINYLYVPGEENIADFYSRLKHISHPHAEQGMQHLTAELHRIVGLGS